ncbi:MAG: F0F1 ATP synthase subunit delta [Campylobacterota bacterium]|nr:F0F1 ATP synthase subunit delta [Campylobacterota bacterium]
MIDLVAKRYVKALMSQRDIDSLSSIYNELNTISTAYNDEKFLLIISSTDVTISKKIDLLLSFNDSCSETTKNLIKLLGDNKRLNIIPTIVKILKQELAILNNTYTGVVYTNVKLSEADMTNMNSAFAKRFDVNLELSQNICDYNGVKVDIEGLGVEIGFSKERLKSQMIEYILKAV